LLEPIRTPSPTEIANPTSFAAGAANLANRTRSTAVLEYGLAETPTLLGPTLLGFARLCRQLPPGMVRIMAENPGFALERTRNPERDGLSAGGKWIRTSSSAPDRATISAADVAMRKLPA